MPRGNPKVYEKKPPAFCARPGCGKQVATTGPTPADGKRYCAKNKTCQAYRDAERYARSRAIPRGDAPTECKACGTALAPRKVRAGDSPLGRWCRKASCQQHRHLLEQQAGAVADEEKVKQAQQSEVEVTDFAVLVVSGERIKCPRCALPDAVPGFKHPAIIGDGVRICSGTGDRPLSKPLANVTWPELMERWAQESAR